MEQSLIIKTNPDSWDDSVITATGVSMDGHSVNCAKTTIRAGSLPQPWLPVWQGVVDCLKGMGDGEVVCMLAVARLVSVPLIEEYGDEVSLTGRDCEKEVVELMLHWQWPDGRMLPPQVVVLADDEAVGLVRFLLDSSTWL